MVRFVFLDLDDTLLDFHRAEAAAMTKTLTALELPADEAVLRRYSEINAAQWRRLETREITRAEVLTGRFDRLFAELGVARSSAQAQALYETALSRGHWFIPGAEALLETLAPLYELYLVSNGNLRVQTGRLESAGIAPYFREIFISELIGADKPQPEFFARCFARIPDFDRAQAVLVGDSLTSDILGGRNAGIRSVWFNPQRRPPRADIPADYEIAALDELPALLRRL